MKALNPKPLVPILGGKLSVEYIAQQLTMLEYDLTRNIRPYDLLIQNLQPSSHLHTYANHFRHVCYFP